MPWLTILGAVPLVGAVVVAALPKGRDLLAKQIALGASLVVLALTIVMALQFDAGGPTFQFTENHEWIPAFGISYSVGVDGIALVLIAMATILVPLVILVVVARRRRGGRDPVKVFFALILVLEAMMIGVFAATDLFLFYVFFEAMLIPVYFLIGMLRRPAALVRRGEVPALQPARRPAHAGRAHRPLRRLGRELGTGTFDYQALTNLDMDGNTQKMLFLGFFFAFAVKAPLWPFHTWLPDAVLGVHARDGRAAHRRARQGRHLRDDPLLPAALPGRLPLLRARDHRPGGHRHHLRRAARDRADRHDAPGRLHLGVALRLHRARASSRSRRRASPGRRSTWSTTASRPPGCSSSVGYLVSRRGSKQIGDYGGVQKVAPLLAGVFLVMGLGSLALPGPVDVRQRDPRADRHLHPLPGRRPCSRRSASSWPRSTSSSGSSGWPPGPETDNVKGFRDLKGRELLAIVPARGDPRRRRLLPEARARRHQPGGRPRRWSRSAPPTRRRPSASWPRPLKGPRRDPRWPPTRRSRPRASSTARSRRCSSSSRRRSSGCSSRRSPRARYRRGDPARGCRCSPWPPPSASSSGTRPNGTNAARGRGRGRHRPTGAVPAGHDPRCCRSRPSC